MARKNKRMTLSVVITSIGLLFNAIIVIRPIVPYLQRPDVVYYVNEVTSYPITYRDNKPAPAEIQGKVLERGPIKILSVVVRDEGQRSASGWVVRIPTLKGDDYLNGWMRESKAPSTIYMLGASTEHPLPKLMPGDSVTFSLNLGNVSSDLAARIEVFDGDGRRAAYYLYVPVRYVGGDAVIIPLRRSWIYLFGLLVNVIALLCILWIRRSKRPATPPDKQDAPDATERLADSTAHSKARGEKSLDDAPNDSAAGGR